MNRIQSACRLIETCSFKNIVLSISCANYISTRGGTDKVIKAHQEMFYSSRISYLHIFPIAKNFPWSDDRTKYISSGYFGASIDKKLLGLFSIKELIYICSAIQKKGYNIIDIHTHQLFRIDIKHLKTLLNSIKSPIKFFVHDYYTICTQCNFLKNGIEFCGPEVMSPSKCSDCKYYNRSKRIQPKVREFFDLYKNRLKIIAPSASAANIWGNAYPNFKNQIIIIYHQQLIDKYYANMESITSNAPLKIAFVGVKAVNKGWLNWKDAVEASHNDNCNYKYYHFGASDDNLTYVNKIDVSFQREGLNAMVTKLREYSIDCVVLASICPETYSYTYYESMSANAFIITNINSGNIASEVQKNNNGIVLKNNNQLKALLCNEKELRDMVNGFKTSNIFGPKDLIENRRLLEIVNDNLGHDYEIIFEKKVSTILSIIITFANLVYRRIKKGDLQ